MTDEIILQTKPSIVPAIATWTIPLVLVACPLFGLTFFFAEILGFVANVLYLVGMLVVLALLLRLAIDIAQLECTTYTLTENQIIKQSGLITQRQQTLPRDRSKTEMQRPLAGRIFNFTSVKVTSTGLETIILRYLPNAQRWQEEIASQPALKVDVEERLASLRGRQNS